jgi:hypothetical protein
MTRKNEAPLKIDMPFGEALERFIGVNPKEMDASIKASKKKKPPGGRKKKPPGGKPEGEVVSLRARRIRKFTGR